MKYSTFIKTIAIASTLAALAPFTAHADTGVVDVINAAPAVLKVKSNGQDYTQIDFQGNIGINMSLEFNTGTAGRIKSWWVEPVIEHGYGIAAIVPGMAFYRQHEEYSVGHRPKSIDENLFFAVSSGMIGDAAISMCNWKANALRNQGKSDAQIFSNNHDVHFVISAKYNVDSTGAGSNNQIWEYSAPRNMTVRCMKHSGPGIVAGGNTLAAPVMVSKATMHLKELAAKSGSCKVDTTTAIVAGQANATIKYRFVHSGGSKSKVFTVKTKGNKIAVVKHVWDIPVVAGPENGWVRIEGVSPGFKSNTAHYSMKCGGGGAVGGFSARPVPKARLKLSN